MSAETIAGLEEAVKAHLADIEPGAVPSGWVLGYTSLNYGEDDAIFGQGYCTSDSTDPARAVGIVETVRRVLAHDLLRDDE